MATAAPTIEMAMKLRLTERARARLAAEAARTGQTIDAVAADLIEQAATRPSIDEVMAPVRQQVNESGMTDEELDAFLRGELDAHRREKKAKSM